MMTKSLNLHLGGWILNAYKIKIKFVNLAFNTFTHYGTDRFYCIVEGYKSQLFPCTTYVIQIILG